MRDAYRRVLDSARANEQRAAVAGEEDMSQVMGANGIVAHEVAEAQRDLQKASRPPQAVGEGDWIRRECEICREERGPIQQFHQEQVKAIRQEFHVQMSAACPTPHADLAPEPLTDGWQNKVPRAVGATLVLRRIAITLARGFLRFWSRSRFGQCTHGRRSRARSQKHGSEHCNRVALSAFEFAGLENADCIDRRSSSRPKQPGASCASRLGSECQEAVAAQELACGRCARHMFGVGN